MGDDEVTTDTPDDALGETPDDGHHDIPGNDSNESREAPGVSWANAIDDSERLGLHRSREHRVIAGVAGGIGERFDVNENLVRTIFVALTLFWGLGAALYLVLWVALRSSLSDGSPSTGRERTPESTSHRLSIAIGAALVVLAVLVVRPVRVLGPGLAGAWLIFLVALSIIAVRTRARRLSIRRVAGVTFLCALSAVIILVGAVMGFLASTGVSLAGGNGDHLWQPNSLSQVSHVYRAEFGRGTLDLSGVNFPTSGFALVVSVAAGELRIVVPRHALVDLVTNVGVGTVTDSPGWVQGVATLPYSSLASGSTAAVASHTAQVSIDARVGVGVIDLMRAAR